MMLTLFLWATVAASSLALPSDWNQETRDYILKIHNDFRRGEGACQMDKMEYDMELERQAKVWAEGCVFEHEMKDGRGENLAWDSNTKPEKELIKGSSQSWFDEKQDYSYGQRSCGMSCHYTQLVWHNTNKVGCWTTRCPYLQNAYSNAWYLVCFYTPMGNWMGEKPYKKTCDAPCLKGQTLEDGLCVGEAEEGASADGGAGGACEDKNPSCAAWAADNQCTANPGYMNKNCKLSCTGCGPKPEAPCEDKNTRCAEWAARSECDKNKSYMHKNCRKSCKKC